MCFNINVYETHNENRYCLNTNGWRPNIFTWGYFYVPATCADQVGVDVDVFSGDFLFQRIVDGHVLCWEKFYWSLRTSRDFLDVRES